MGDAGFLTDLYTRIKKPNFLGDTLWFTGTVTGKRRSEAGALVDCELNSVNQRGALVGIAQSTARLPMR